MTCTIALATGLTSLRGNLLGQSHDCAHDWETIRVKLVIPESGNRYLKTCGPGPDNLIPILSEKGVGAVGFARPSRDFPSFPGTPRYISEDELMRNSGSACEWVDAWSQNMTQYGTPGFLGASSIGRMIVDAEEGYLCEGANLVYGDRKNHAIHGPMTDQVFACANFFVNSRLKVQVESGIGAGYNRAKRVWKMLIDRQYDGSVMEGAPPRDRKSMPHFGTGISLPYFMSIFKDHGNLSPEEGRMNNYLPEERGQEAVCLHGMVYYTKCATIINPVENHSDLFSCLWITFGQPCLSPFLPIYIGVESLPANIDKPANPLAQVFEQLRLALEYHPDMAEKIKQHWKVFEIQTIEDSIKVEKAAASFAEQGKYAEARKLLTGFIFKKWELAFTSGQQWLKKLREMPD
jgi:hypothetical protein